MSKNFKPARQKSQPRRKISGTIPYCLDTTVAQFRDEAVYLKSRSATSVNFKRGGEVTKFTVELKAKD